MIPLRDARPIGHARAAQRIDGEFELGARGGLEIEDGLKILDVIAQKIVLARRRGLKRRRVRHALDFF